MFKRRLISMVLLALLIPTVVLAADCPCTIDTLAGAANGFALGDSASSEFGNAQTFVATGSGTFDGFSIRFGASVGSPTGNVTWGLYGDFLNSPGLLIASGTFAPVASSTVSVTVSGGPAVNQNGLYWMTFEVPAQTTDNRYTQTGSSTSTYAPGGRFNRTNGGAWTTQTGDLQLVVTIGALVATNTPTATSATATPVNTATPTITPSPTPNYAIEVTATSGAPMKLERSADYGDLTNFGGQLMIVGMLFFLFVYTYWRDRARAGIDS